MNVQININGKEEIIDVKSNDTLLTVLRRKNIISVKDGCEQGCCGSCTVLVDDKPVLSCGLLAAKVEEKHVTTVEGIQEEANRLADYFGDEGADQCSFCSVGFALIVHALRKEYKNPTDEQIKDYIVGNICRCTGYQSQFKAIKAYLKEAK